LPSNQARNNYLKAFWFFEFLKFLFFMCLTMIGFSTCVIFINKFKIFREMARNRRKDVLFILLFVIYLLLRIFSASEYFLLQNNDAARYLALADSFPKNALANNQLNILHPPLYAYAIHFFSLFVQDHIAGLLVSVLSSVIMFFILWKFFLIHILWQDRSFPPEPDDSYNYISQIAAIADCKGFHFCSYPGVSMGDSTGFVYLSYRLFFGWLAKITQLSSQTIYHFGFYLGTLFLAFTLYPFNFYHVVYSSYLRRPLLLHRCDTH